LEKLTVYTIYKLNYHQTRVMRIIYKSHDAGICHLENIQNDVKEAGTEIKYRLVSDQRVDVAGEVTATGVNQQCKDDSISQRANNSSCQTDDLRRQHVTFA